MTGYVQDGDVHTNSGIPNHAFYLAATAIGGNAWEAPGRNWYRALQGMHATTTFEEAARATLEAAAAVCGAESREWRAVCSAWTAVKVLRADASAA